MSLYTSPIKKPSYFDRIGYQAGLLAGICCLVAVLILGGNQATKVKIAEVLRQDQLNMLSEVLPEYLYNNNLLEEALRLPQLAEQFGSDTLYVAKKDEQIVGYAFLVAEEGYSGQIKIIMGIDDTGSIIGVRVVSHTETPGLGDKIEIARSNWITSFEKKSLANTRRSQWAVKKDGGQFDQFSGATITPRAVVRAVLHGLDFYSNYQAQSISNVKTDSISQTSINSTEKTNLTGKAQTHE